MTVYSNEYGTVNFWQDSFIFEDRTKIGISLSGGADSAMLLYLLCLEAQKNPLLSLITMTGVDLNNDGNLLPSKKIVKFIKNQFPSVNIDHHIFTYSRNTNESKSPYHKRFQEQMRKDGKIDLLCIGLTRNPPVESLDKLGLSVNREVLRDTNDHKETLTKTTYRPFKNVDKKFIAKLYEEFKLRDSLFLLTQSCVNNNAAQTENGTKPCKLCWWCKEKYWAFGCYDFGIQ